jgi:uncharacterized protein YcfJ
MMRQTIFAAAILVSAASVASAQEGVTTGAATGAVGGALVGGPVGAVVGAVGGAIVGGIAEDNQKRFRTYVVEERRPSYRYEQQVVVGAELPEAGVTYYDVPPEYGRTEYRYTVVNDRTVLVDPRTHRIVQVIE